MATVRAPVDETEHRLIHVDAVHAVLVQHRVGDSRVLVAPERRGRVHGGTGERIEHVVRLETHAAIALAHRPLFRTLARPAGRIGAPEALVHVHDSVQSLLVRLRHGTREGLGAFARRQIVGEARVVRSLMPPVPEHTDRKLGVLLQQGRWREHVVRRAAVPFPDARVAHPGRGRARS